jgi:tyrosyl-tRNA synthetase
MLTPEEIEANAATYIEQAGAVVDMERAEVRRNSEWLAPMRMDDVLRLTSRYTVARMLERDDFAKRYASGQPISVVEFLYPLMQAIDSVAVRADVELGGTDQTFNLLVGREIQRAYGQEPQVVVTVPLLLGTDGARKMSKSLGNYVGLTEPPEEMFGKLMSIPDTLIVQYLELCTLVPAEEVAEVRSGLGEGLLRPDVAKRRMAREVVDLYHGVGAGHRAEERFNRVHRDRELPEDIQEVPIPADLADDGAIWVPRLMQALGLADSNAEARRRIEQGGVRLGGEVLADPSAELSPDALRGKVLQVGRRRFVRLV